MRVALLTETFSKDMGYLHNVLPRYLARMGVEVHLITMDLAPYYQISGFKETYGDFTGAERLNKGKVESYDGYTLHVLPHKSLMGYMRMVGLRAKLEEIKPDIVQAWAAIGWIPLDAALARNSLGYKLFTGNHTVASVFPLARTQVAPWNTALLKCYLTRFLPGRLVSWFTELCYGATQECCDIAIKYFGVQPKKAVLSPLGVDTDNFEPITTERHTADRQDLRKSFGFADSDIVCVYSGRFTRDKNPLLLAEAISRLVAAGEPYKGLFVGAGVQQEAISECPGCVVHPFVPFTELGRYFRAGEIGVWPAQESMSMIDAATCGIPIVVNHTMTATERIDGNGLTYMLGDASDLVRVVLSLKNPEIRQKLGSHGAEKMARDFSWSAIARRRLTDYEAAVNKDRGSR